MNTPAIKEWTGHLIYHLVHLLQMTLIACSKSQFYIATFSASEPIIPAIIYPLSKMEGWT